MPKATKYDDVDIEKGDAVQDQVKVKTSETLRFKNEKDDTLHVITIYPEGSHKLFLRKTVAAKKTLCILGSAFPEGRYTFYVDEKKRKLKSAERGRPHTIIISNTSS
jgi:hypothetical protein